MLVFISAKNLGGGKETALAIANQPKTIGWQNVQSAITEYKMGGFIMKALTRYLSVVMFLIAASAGAVIPEPGLWWNPNESGRGYTIEIQDDRVFVTYYAYHPDSGKSAFFTTFGTLNSRTGVVSGYWARSENGQCFGCSYREPQLTGLGDARLVFTTPTTGRIELPGHSPIPIERQRLYGSHNHDRPVLKGVWTVVFGALGIHFGDVLIISGDDSTVNGGVRGHRADAPSRRLLGGPTNDPSLPAVLLLLDSSPSHYTAHAFNNSLGAWVGRTWTYPKTGSLSGAGLPAFGNKLMGINVAGQVTNKLLPGAELEGAIYSLDNMLELATSSQGFEGPPGQVTIGEQSYDVSAIRAALWELDAEFRK